MPGSERIGGCSSAPISAGAPHARGDQDRRQHREPGDHGEGVRPAAGERQREGAKGPRGAETETRQAEREAALAPERAGGAPGLRLVPGVRTVTAGPISRSDAAHRRLTYYKYTSNQY